MKKPVEVSFSYPLTVPTKGKTLPVNHFPTAYQTLVFRLWEMVDYRKIAKVLKTSDENVLRCAEDMGLGKQNILDAWMSRGYITIIKAVWNLLPYEQIYELLDWDADHLAYILQEDDFLSTKLGEKCDCAPVYYRELTAEEQVRTAEIKQTMLSAIRPLDSEETAKPFDFYRSTYAPIVENVVKEVVVDSSWSLELPEDSGEIDIFVADFKTFAKKYGVVFAEKSDKKIRIAMDVQTEDEEYREVAISDGEILIRAGHAVGVLRGLYDLEDLVESVGTFSFEKKTYRKKTKVKTRIIYSFSSLYTGTLEKDTALSFPDELLEGYGRRGINGIWLQAVLYQMAPYPFAENLSEGWEKRLANLEALTKRAARYGIKVYLYINEPRNMPASFFEHYPQMKGAELRKGWHCLCSSHPDTQKYMKDAMQTLCRKVPLLGGFINITQSENRALCCSQGIHTAPEDLCPVCSQRKNSEVNAEAIRIMCDAIAEVAPKMKFFAWAWAWVQHLGKEDTNNLLHLLPKNAIVMQVSESQIPFERGGIRSFVRDYSISIVGPGDPAKEMWKTARERGLEVAAKVQINNTWECSSVPYLPVYENVAQHMKNLIDEGVEHMLLSWTLGGYISDNIKIASSYFFEEECVETDAYAQVLDRNYGPYAQKVREAVSHFCRGFDEYPFNVWHAYRSPCNNGVANLLYPEPSGMKCTMTCYPYDDMEGWCGARPGDQREGTPYPPEVLEDQYRKLCEHWEKGLAVLEGMPQCEFYDMALYGYTLFKSTYNHISYVRQRDGERNEAVMRKAVESERELALLAYRIMLRNAAVGFEAANHYYVARYNLTEKVVQCDYLLAQAQKEADMEQREIFVKSTLDGSIQPNLFYRADGEGKRPLLVGLHTWSYDRYNPVDLMLPYAQKYGFHFLSPEFRGTNLNTNPNCTKACGSEYAKQDIKDAIDHVVAQGGVDTDNIFVLGLSGGGHMALLMAGFCPEYFKAVGAFVPITDLKRWTEENANYRGHVLACCSGDEAEMEKRSPIHYIDTVARSNTKLFHGKYDPVVPFTHSMRFYEQLLLKHPSAQVYLDIFDGGHTVDMELAMHWILTQYQKTEKTAVTG